MYILRIEHPVSDFDTWKEAFDSDPIGRERSGVRRYRVLRAIDEPNYVMIDLEFDKVGEAEAVHAALRDLWGHIDVNAQPTSADRRDGGDQEILSPARRGTASRATPLPLVTSKGCD